MLAVFLSRSGNGGNNCSHNCSPWVSTDQQTHGATLPLSWQLLAEHADSLHLTSGFEATINKFDSNFSTHLLDLLDKLSVYSTNDCEHSMLNIIYR